MPEETTQLENLSFEEAMQSLDDIVSSLESERLPLEQMVGSYEQGMKLLRVCRSRIESAKQRVELIHLDLEGKAPATLTDFSSSSVEADAERTSAESPDRPKRSPARKKNTTPDEDQESSDIRLF